MTKGRILNIFLFVFFVIILCSCDPHQVYERNVEIPGFIWHKDSILKFEVDVQDTINPHNIYINVRNSSRYKMQNLFIFVQTTAPGGSFLRDTFECYLADERGKWTGSGWGDIYDNQFLYKKSIRFPVSGVYTFEYIQAMRTDNLEFISDIGLRIEKVEIR
ncbi:MAG: gliding motility lipoprotein GldH [Bacteroidales bacterium]|nr:gliding motility lipoprotein GldH [Bacteroidales bacterium]